jgi:hypothetical protein
MSKIGEITRQILIKSSSKKKYKLEMTRHFRLALWLGYPFPGDYPFQGENPLLEGYPFLNRRLRISIPRRLRISILRRKPALKLLPKSSPVLSSQSLLINRVG